MWSDFENCSLEIANESDLRAQAFIVREGPGGGEIIHPLPASVSSSIKCR